MATRITKDDVKATLKTQESDENIEKFIETSHIFIDNLLQERGLKEDLLKMLELYYAAHLICLKERRARRERIGDYEISYEGMTGSRLNITPYGQNCINLDISGTLAMINHHDYRGKATVEFI